MSRSGRALLSVLALVTSALAGAADATAHPEPVYPVDPVFPIDPGVPENQAPAVATMSTVDSGALPLTIGFDATGTTDPDGDLLSYAWDFTEDGVPDAEGPSASWTFTTPGQHTARVTVTDAHGAVSTGDVPVVAGNTRPTVVIDAPVDGGFSQPGEALPFKLTVTDPDGAVDCTKVVVTYGSLTAAAGPDCAGVLTVPAPQEGAGTFSARYSDGGAAGVPALTASADVVLNPREHQAPSAEPYLDGPSPRDGTWFTIPHVDLAGVDHLSMELAAPRPGGTVTVHADSPAGPVVATFPNVPATDSRYQWFAADVVDPGGAHDLYFVTGPDTSARYLRFQTVPAVTATVPRANGWHTEDVPVSVSAAPLWDPQVSLDGGVTWTPAATPVVLSADGTHDVRYRAVDAAGRVSETGATAVRIDRTAPVLALPGREHTHAAPLPLAATDAGSGLATFTATLDGNPVPAEPWQVLPGTHELTVTATDAAGNTATHTGELVITTSIPELLPAFERFGLPSVKELIMRLQLMAAERAHEAGDMAEAAEWVRKFRYSAALLRDTAARDTLTAHADFVLTQG